MISGILFYNRTLVTTSANDSQHIENKKHTKKQSKTRKDQTTKQNNKVNKIRRKQTNIIVFYYFSAIDY